MLLKNYLDDLRMKPHAFSLRCRISPGVVYRILEELPITRKSIKIVTRVTKGLVKYKNIKGRK